MKDQKRERISNIIGELDEHLVTQALQKPKRSKRLTYLKWGAAAACMVLILGGGLYMLPGNQVQATNIGGVTRYYKEDTSWQTESVAKIWEWNYLTINEQYSTITHQGKTYQTGKKIDEIYIGDYLGEGSGEGYDVYTEQYFTRTFPLYRIKKLATQGMIAAEMDGEYYICKQSEYAPPATLSEILTDYALPETASLQRFTVNQGYEERGHYTVEDDAIWEMIRSFGESPFVEDEHWSLDKREAICFTISSDALGVYKRALYVTKDGYLWTNFFDYGYLFSIGEDAADRIISYAKKEGKAVDYAPYYETVAGVVTEIQEDYILLDDSILCQNPEDGMVFTVMTVDESIRRYFQSGEIDMEDFISVSFTGEVLINNGDYTITMVQTIQKAHLYEDEVLVEE